MHKYEHQHIHVDPCENLNLKNRLTTMFSDVLSVRSCLLIGKIFNVKFD